MIVPLLQRPQRDEPPCQAPLRRPLEFRNGVLHVIDIQHGNALEPLGVRVTEVGEPIVIDPWRTNVQNSRLDIKPGKNRDRSMLFAL